MTELFLDSSFSIVLTVPSCQLHHLAVEFTEDFAQLSLVTTTAVLCEIGNALAKQRLRPTAPRANLFYPTASNIGMRQGLCRLSFTIAVILLPAVRDVSACTCGYRSDESPFHLADAVFRGRMVHSEWAEPQTGPYRSSADPVEYLFLVEEVYKGLPEQSRVTVRSPAWGASCGAGFKKEKSYLVFASRSQDGRLSTSLCSGNLEFAPHAPMARWVERHQLGDHRSFIAGSLSLHQLNPILKERLTTLEVHLEGMDESRFTRLKSDGTFHFDDLAPGSYRLVLELPGFDPKPLEREVTLNAPLGFDQVFFRAPSEPAGGIELPLADAEGLTCLIEVDVLGPESNRGAEVKDGRIEAYHRIPGEYRFSIHLEGYGEPILYPPAGTPGIQVEARMMTEPEAWKLPAAWRVERLEGRVVFPDGSPASNAQVNLIGSNSRSQVQADAEGRFRVTLCRPLRYESISAFVERDDAEQKKRLSGSLRLSETKSMPSGEFIIRLNP